MKINYKFILMGTLFVLMLSSFNFAESTSVIDIYVGESFDLDSYLVEDKQISSDAKSVWKSGDTSIIKVDSAGKVTALKEGRTYISVVMDTDDRSTSAIVIINVKSAVKTLKFYNKKVSLVVGDFFFPYYKLISFDKNQKIYNNKIKLVSADDGIVKFTKSNHVLAIKAGKTKVFAYTEDGNRTDSFEVEVVAKYDKIYFKNIKANQVFYVGESVVLDYVDGKGNALPSSIVTSFLPSKSGIISTSKKNLKFESEGELRIDAKHDGIKNAAVYVIIKSLVSGIEIDKTNIKFDAIGEESQLSATLIPAYSDREIIENTIVWSSSNSRVASVDKNGLVTSKGFGIARIKASSKDSGREDYVSVEVIGEKKNIKVTSVKASPIKDNCIIGEELLLNVDIEPKNAVNNISFVMKKGKGQVISKDGEYYFKANHDGDFIVKAISSTGPTDEFEIKVVQSLDKINISENIMDERQRNILYIGQREDVNISFIPKNGFSHEDIFTKDYSVVSSNGMLTIENKNENGFTVKANSKGIATLTIKSNILKKEERLLFEVRPLIKSIDVEDKIITNNVSEKNEVRVKMTPLENIYNFTEVFDPKYTTSIRETYISRDYIVDEVNYEKESILELEEVVKTDSFKYTSLKDEISRRRKRLNLFNALLSSNRGEYVRYFPSLKITNRLGEPLKVYSLDGNNIIGHIRAYVTYIVKSKDSDKVDDGKIIFVASSSKFVVVKDEKIVASSENDLKTEIEKENIQIDKKKLEDRLSNRFGGLEDRYLPSEDNSIFIIDLEEQIELDEELKQDYDKIASKEDALRILLNVYESHMELKLKAPAELQFIDDETGVATRAYNIGVVSRTKDRMYKPDEEITLIEFERMYEKIRYAIVLKSESKEIIVLPEKLDVESKNAFKNGLSNEEMQMLILNLIKD